MSIVCGIDFSPSSHQAALVAGRLATRLGTTLKLVHVIDVQSEELFAPWRAEMTRAVEEALQREVSLLRAEGVDAEPHLLHGRPDEALTTFAHENGARVLVVSAVGTRSPEQWPVGASADRIAQQATCPVLVIRDPQPLTDWLAGQRPLKVMLGMDRTETSHAALTFVGELRKAGPCDVDVEHLYWAPEEFHRLGFAGVRSIVDPDPEVERILREELEADVAGLPGSGEVRVRVELCVGRPSDRLTALAQERKADLVVVGSHHRNLADRLWRGSVSRSVLHDVTTNVGCVTAKAVTQEVSIPRVRTVLVATDFSDTGNAAIRWAYGLAGKGGVVHLATVHSPESRVHPLVRKDIFEGPHAPAEEATLQELRRDLQSLEPSQARSMGIITRVHALTSDSAGAAICQAAERLHVDVVVLGTHGRTGVARAVLGSVAQSVAAKCPRPVMLVSPPPV